LADEPLTVVAGNGTVVEAGGVYLTFSGDPDTPYTFAKVVSIGGSGASLGVQLGPDLRPVPSQDLWVKLYRGSYAERPDPSEVPTGPSRILPITVAMFLAWGPPTFPIRVGTEAVTADELAARGQDSPCVAEPLPPDDLAGTEASLVVVGPMSADDERRVLWDVASALWRELRDLLVNEDVELRHGMTHEGVGGPALEVEVHFRVSDVVAALGVVRRCYARSGLSLPASVRVYGPDADVVATHPIGCADS
jgi:hypothetical protein